MQKQNEMKVYQNPAIEIISLDAKDVIVTSSLTAVGEGGGMTAGWNDGVIYDPANLPDS